MPKHRVSDVDSDETDWNTFTIPELKAELRLRGLPVGGNKAELVARIEAQIEAQPDHPHGTTPASRTAAPATRAPKSKKARARSPEPLMEGPLASDVIRNQMMNPQTGERRLRQFVPAPDDKFKDKFKRINRERMFMLDRKMTYDRDGHPFETFTIAGSTGNIYTCSIGTKPKCDCMDARIRGQKCKHINYALIIILKAPIYLQYQLAFLSDELEEIFANAPITRAPDFGHDENESDHPSGQVIRKPIEGDCPICVFEMSPEEDLVWCMAACGQNFHRRCFEQWRQSKMGGLVTCVYCRSEWQDEHKMQSKSTGLEKLKKSAPKIGLYQNIGHLPMYQNKGE